MRIETPGAAGTLSAILRHAAAEREGLVSLRAGDGELLAASSGETSLVLARFETIADPAVNGAYDPPPKPVAGEDGPVSLEATATGVRVRLAGAAVTLRRTGDPIDVDWLWPATSPTLEALVSRDALLEALPGGEGRLTYSGADKQLVVQAGRVERRVPIKNRPRRRNDLGTAVAFDQLRLLAEAAGPDLAVQLADLRPLTIESGTVRGVLVRGAPMRWTPAAERPTPKRTTAAQAKAEAARAKAAESERIARDRERAEAIRARTAAQVGRALTRAAIQLDAAAEAARELGDDALVAEIETAGRAARTAAGRLPPASD